MDVVPNLAFAAMAGGALPGADPATGFEGASMADRLGASLFDFALSYPTGATGRLLGAGATRGLGALRGRPFGPGTEGMVQNIAGIGTETALWGSGLLRNPATEAVFNRYNEAAMALQEQDKRAYREQVIAEEQERRAHEQQALIAGGVGALLGPYGITPYGIAPYGLGGLG